MANLRQFLKENPQVAVLAVIALVLGIGTFLIVVIALATSGSTRTDGEPSDVILLGHTFAQLVGSIGLG